MFFFQLPPKLPAVKNSANMKGKEIIDASSSSKPSSSTGNCNLEDLPEGYMGKLLVYKSGKIKLKLGETSYDVSCYSQNLHQLSASGVSLPPTPQPYGSSYSTFLGDC